MTIRLCASVMIGPDADEDAVCVVSEAGVVLAAGGGGVLVPGSVATLPSVSSM